MEREEREDVRQALVEFTRRYCDAWLQHTGHGPESEELYGVPSPCIVSTQNDRVIWQPCPFNLPPCLDGVERALDLQVQAAGHVFYTSQLAGDMNAQFEHISLTLLQTWSEADFVRVQENLIGHLVTQKRLRLSPTLFLATTDSETDVVSLCNLTGSVVLERLGARERTVLSSGLDDFLNKLTPRL